VYSPTINIRLLTATASTYVRADTSNVSNVPSVVKNSLYMLLYTAGVSRVVSALGGG